MIRARPAAATANGQRRSSRVSGSAESSAECADGGMRAIASMAELRRPPRGMHQPMDLASQRRSEP
jgi:hypothetical protein